MALIGALTALEVILRRDNSLIFVLYILQYRNWVHYRTLKPREYNCEDAALLIGLQLWDPPVKVVSLAVTQFNYYWWDKCLFASCSYRDYTIALSPQPAGVRSGVGEGPFSGLSWLKTA